MADLPKNCCLHAFPLEYGSFVQTGLTRLDYFVAAAMRGILSNPVVFERRVDSQGDGMTMKEEAEQEGDLLSHLAVRFALATLREIEKVTSDPE